MTSVKEMREYDLPIPKGHRNHLWSGNVTQLIEALRDEGFGNVSYNTKVIAQGCEQIRLYGDGIQLYVQPVLGDGPKALRVQIEGDEGIEKVLKDFAIRKVEPIIGKQATPEPLLR